MLLFKPDIIQADILLNVIYSPPLINSSAIKYNTTDNIYGGTRIPAAGYTADIVFFHTCGKTEDYFSQLGRIKKEKLFFILSVKNKTLSEDRVLPRKEKRNCLYFTSFYREVNSNFFISF